MAKTIEEEECSTVLPRFIRICMHALVDDDSLQLLKILRM